MSRGSNAAFVGKRRMKKKLPGMTREHFQLRLVCDLDEAGELELALGDLLRPDGSLLPALPLQHQSGDQALAVLDGMGELIVLAIELDSADRAFPVGLLERCLLYTSPSPRDGLLSRMPSSA